MNDNIIIKQYTHEADTHCFEMTPANIATAVNSYREKVRRLLADKLDSIYLFGSVARGDYTPVSDIDVMLILNMNDDEIRKTRSGLAKIGSDLGLEYNVLFNKFTAAKDEFEINQDIRPLYINIMKEGVRL